MSPTKPLLLSTAFFLSACISLPAVEGPDDPPDDDPDAGLPPSLTVTLAAPGGMTYTNSAVSVQLQLQGDAPERVELLVDDQPLTTLQAPYTFTWDTTSVTEGPHQLSARAHIADKTFTSEPREVVVDRTPPQLVSRTPLPGAQDVWVRQPIQATFSEPVKPSTLTSAAVKLLAGGTEVASTASLTTDGRTLTVAPAMRPTVPNSLQVTLTSAVTDLAGNSLTLPSDGWGWNLPLSFALGGLSAVSGETDTSIPILQFDPQGKLVVSWREATGTNFDYGIYTYRLEEDSWQPAANPIIVPDRLSYSAPEFVSRLDSTTSHPVVAWTQLDGDLNSGIYTTYIKRWSGSEWVTATAAPGSAVSHRTHPTTFTFRLDDNERPIIAWSFYDRDAFQYSLLHVWRWTDSTWLELASEASSSGPRSWEDSVKLLLDDSGKPVVAMDQIDITAYRWTGSDWVNLGSALGASPGNTPALLGDMLLDRAGNPFVAWTEQDSATMIASVYVARFTGTNWEMLGTPLSAVDGTTAALNPRLQLDNTGNLLIAWEEFSQQNHSGPLQINLRRWTGSEWVAIGDPFLLSQGNADPLKTSFVLDRSGNPYIAWPEKNGTGAKSIRIHRYNY